MPKTIEENFVDWESSAFGFGYGSGEEHVLRALKGFFDLIGEDQDQPRSYNYERLEEVLGAPVAWLLINVLCRHGVDIIEYGTSPRFAWLTQEGLALKAFVDSKTVSELVALCCEHEADICYPGACNCGPKGYEEGRICQNPFWRGHHP